MPDPIEPESLALLRHARAGDRDALNLLIARYYDRVARIARVRLGPRLRAHIDANDIVQSAFAAALPRLADFEPRDHSSLIQWLSRIVENTIRNEHDRWSAARRNPSREVRVEQPEYDDRSSTILMRAERNSEPAHEVTPSTTVSNDELRHLYDECVAQLETGQRDLILLREYAGASWDAIVAELRLPNAHAAQESYRRAQINLRRKLRPLLQPQLSGGRNAPGSVASLPAPPGSESQKGLAIPGMNTLRVLHSGRSSTVLLAQRASSKERVTIKVVEPQLREFMLGRERLGREIRIGAVVKSDLIVPILESGSVGLSTYAVMPYYERGSLRDFIQRKREGEPALDTGPALSSLRQASRWCREIADGLTALHSQGYLHMDIKPSNVLVSDTGGLLLADLGFARSLADSKDLESGRRSGTPEYMSPEQAGVDAYSVGVESDVFAVGVILYELTTGTRPFSGTSPEVVVEAVQRCEPIAPRVINPNLPVAVESLILRCMQRDPKLRFRSSAQLSRALEELS